MLQTQSAPVGMGGASLVKATSGTNLWLQGSGGAGGETKTAKSAFDILGPLRSASKTFKGHGSRNLSLIRQEKSANEDNRIVDLYMGAPLF